MPARFLLPITCTICGRAVQVAIAKDDLSKPAPTTCGLTDCRPPKIRTKPRTATPEPRRRADPRALETPLVHACLELLALRGYGETTWRHNSGALKIPAHFDGTRLRKRRYVQFGGKDGASDILGFLPPNGRFLAIECKVGKNRPTKAQREFLDAVKRAGGLALLIYDDVRALDEALRKEGY